MRTGIRGRCRRGQAGRGMGNSVGRARLRRLLPDQDGRTSRDPGTPSRAHRRRRARARDRLDADDGAGPRRVPRRRQRGSHGRAAPGGPLRGPCRRHLRRRPVPRLPGPAPADVLRARPLRGVRRPAPGRPAAARQRGHAVPPPPRTRAGQPVGGLRPRGDARWSSGSACGRVVSMGSVPMAVPHTRPIAITHHANNRELLTGESPWRGELRIPSSAQALLEIRLGEHGHDAMGFVAHVPHYLAQLDYPKASRLAAGAGRARGPADDRPDRAADGGRGAGGRDRALPRGQRGGRRRGRRPRAAVRRLRARRGVRHQPAGRRTSRCPPARRSASSSSSSSPASTGRPTVRPTTPTGGLTCRRPPRSSSSCSTSRSSTPTSSAGRQPDTDRQRVFGGQVAAQALIAGVRTVDPAYRVHSLHSYFLLPGDTAVPIVYDVEQLRDGRSFATRRVVARQHGRPIYYLTASFQRDEQGFEHQDVMPEVARPGGRPRLRELTAARRRRGRDAFAREWAALDVRYIGNSRRGLADDPTTRRRPGCGSGSTGSCPTTRWSTWRRSPTPAT